MSWQKRVYFDTESCQYIGPTILIQHGESSHRGSLGDIHLHNIWTNTAGSTCRLIEDLISAPTLVGFNLAHDIFHLARSYNILRLFNESEIPQIADYCYIQSTEEARQCFLLPENPLDLLVYGQQNEFQAIMKQAPIVLKRVPKVLATMLVEELTERIQLNPLYFAGMSQGYRWVVKELWAKNHPDFGGKEVIPEEYAKAKKGELNLQIDPDFVNLVCPFNPKKGLKDIVEHLILRQPTQHFEAYAQKYKERFWNLTGDDWIDVFPDWKEMWIRSKKQLEYARKDVLYTFLVDRHFEYPDGNDYESVLACTVGNTYWKGWDINREKTGELLEKKLEKKKYYKEILPPVNSPKQVRAYLVNGNPIYGMLVKDTSADTLHKLADSESIDLSEKAKMILEARTLDKEINLLMKILEADKLFVQFKITGTKSRRMSGGSLEGKGESINPQGWPSVDEMREIITFTNNPGMMVSGGDADSFEVCIAAKVYDDKQLTEQLLSGMKFHGIMGSLYYNIDYEEVLGTKNTSNDLYKKAKSTDFGWFYGGQIPKLAATAEIPEEQMEEALEKAEKLYPGIRLAREQIWEDYAALKQPAGIGTQVVWDEPKEYVESFLGFKRYFIVEIEVMRALFDLAQNLPKRFREMKDIKVTRRDRIQGADGAAMSALYAAAFNMQSSIMRVASNHKIQSPGGDMIKRMQYRCYNKFQPRGINEWNIALFNVHDELISVHKPEIVDKLEAEIKSFEQEYKQHVPLFKMEWKKNIKHWGDTH